VVDLQFGLGLPLVHHLVQQRVLDLSPTVPGDMLPAQGELERPTGPDIHRELAQPPAHPAGEPDRNLSQSPGEVPLVELVIERLQPVKQEDIPWTGTLAAAGSRRGWCVHFYRELEKLALGHSAQRPRNPGVEVPNDCHEHPVGRVGVASMNAEDAPVEAEHHRTIGVGDDSINISQPELLKPDGKTILE
jgi:hypothetical protein